MNTNAPTTIVAVFANTEDGVEAIVAKTASGYSVVIHDTDADEYLDGVRIYPTEAAALAYAAGVVPQGAE
jgi:hypothetical protein